MQNIQKLRGVTPEQAWRDKLASEFRRAGAGQNVTMSKADFARVVGEFGALAVRGQRDVQSLFAYSSILWLVEGEEVETNTVFTLAATDANERKFFSYGVEDPANALIVAGFPAAYQARYDDTNLSKGGRPPFGTMLIDRIGFAVRAVGECYGHDPDPRFLDRIMGQVSIKIGTNGSSKLLRPIGTMKFWPAHIALQGAGYDPTATVAWPEPDLGNGVGAWAVRKLDKPLLWKQNNDGVDDSLLVVARVEHDIVATYPTGEGLTNTKAYYAFHCIVAGHSVTEVSANG